MVRAGLRLILVSTAVLVVSGPDGEATSNPILPAGRTVRMSAHEGNSEIYLKDAAGRVTRLTVNPAFDYAPVLSPDGRRIAFVSDRDGNDGIYLMAADGTHVTRLTRNAGRNVDPVFSPDGRWIAFVSSRDGNEEVYMMRADGTRQTNLSRRPAYDFHPQFNADGRQVVFESNRDGGIERYAVRVDGTGPVSRLGPPRSAATGAGLRRAASSGR